MSKTVLLLPDQHAHTDYDNDRADWVGQLLVDLKPDVLVNMGDSADLPSLSGFDKGKAAFYAANYEKDIEAHLDFQERLFEPLRKSKRKQPYKVFLVGNHEQRIEKVLSYDPHLGGDRFGLSMKNLDLERCYNEVVPYNGSTPGMFHLDGVMFAHYCISGVMGRAISGVNHATSLINKNHCSTIVGHSHTFDFSVQASSSGKTLMGLVCGVYQDYTNGWAGGTGALWHRGLCILRDFEDGHYDLEWVSMKRMRDTYGT